MLSFRSYIHSSGSLSLLFIPSSVFISAIEFFISDWVFFIVYSSLLKFLLCTSILFPNSVNILITNALNSLSGKLFLSISLFFSECFFGSFNWQQFLCIFILLNFLCLYEFRWNSYLLLLEGLFLCGAIPVQVQCVHCLWWESWIWCGSKSHLSSGFAGSYHLGRRWG